MPNLTSAATMATTTTTTPSGAISSFASLEEQIAHLNWRKVCNERQIQGTLRRSKQLQERDEFQRAAAAASERQDASRREWMHAVIQHEFSKPLPVTTHEFDALTAQLQHDEARAQRSAQKHLQQIDAIQRKLDAREAQLARKKAFERKRGELFASE